MIVLHILRGLLGEDGADSRELPWDAQTGAGLLAYAQEERPEWEGVPLVVTVNGAMLEEDALEQTLPDGCHVVVAPYLAGIGIGTVLLIALLVTAGASIALQFLMPPPVPEGITQERGDESSPTYAWDGVATSFGQGLPVPVAYGEIDLGGQYIHTNALAETSVTGAHGENLYVILALCEGRCDSIGGITGGPIGEADLLGRFAPIALPADIRVNENRLDPTAPFPQAATVYLRMGELSQSPLPPPFVGAAATFTVNERLEDANQSAVFTISTDEEIASVSIILSAPSGLYEQSPTGQIQGVSVALRMEWRPLGSTGGFVFFFDAVGEVISLFTVPNPSVPHQGRFAATIIGELNLPGTPSGQRQRGPIEVRVTRITARGGTNTVDSLIWRQAVASFPNTFAYPRTCLIGLHLPASEKLSGGLPTFVIRGKWKRVRVWDQSLGWSPYTWEVPAAPFNFHQYPPGNNPAWVLLDFLLDPIGLGDWVKEENIDLEAFRDWAIYCDEQPGPAGQEWDEPRYRFDGVFDRPRPAWEWVLAITRAGGAAPVIRGNKISVKYQYRDSHGDSGAGAIRSVPPKIRAQLFTDSNVDELEVHYINRGNRPTVLDFDFLDRDKDFRRGPLPIEETESYLGHLGETPPLRERGFRREAVDAFGITRSTQIYRLGVFMHRANRLIRKEIKFRTGVWALAAEPGDVIGFQHDVLRPFDTESFGLTIVEGGEDVTQVTVNRPLALSGGTDVLIMRVPNGPPIERQVTAITGAGSNVLTLVTSASVNPGAPAAFGQQDAVVEDYEIVDIDLSQDLMRRVRAVQWVPEVHEEPPASAGASGLDSTNDVGPAQADSRTAPPQVDAADIVVEPSLLDAGKLSIAWENPAGARRRTARVYARPVGADTWWSIGETRAEDALVDWPGFAAWTDWEVVVAIQDGLGHYRAPEELTPAVVTVPEFPRHSPPKVSNVQLVADARGWRLVWDPITYDQIAHYEVREGSTWVGGKVVYRGREPWFVHSDPAKLGDLYHVAVRSSSGLYSLEVETIAPPGEWHPPGTAAAVADVDAIPPPTSLPAELAWHSAEQAIAVREGQYVGTYTAPVLDLGFEAFAYWSVSYDHVEHDGATIDDLAFEIDSGEGRWRAIDAREATAGMPGIDWDLTIDDLAVAIDDMPDEATVAGQRGEAGSHTLARIESRFYVGGSWGAWGPHRNGWRAAERMATRVTLARDSQAGNAFLKRLSLGVSI